MSETMGAKPMTDDQEDPIYTDAELIEWALAALQGYGLDRRPDLDRRLRRLADRLRVKRTGGYTLEDVTAAVETATASYLLPQEIETVQCVVADVLQRRLKEIRR